MWMSQARVLANLRKKKQNIFSKQDGFWGCVLVGDQQQPICLPQNSIINVLGKTDKMLKHTTHLVDHANNHNLPVGIVVNQCLTHPKAKVVPVILVNINNYNICIRQPLLTAKLYDVEYHPWEYRTILGQDGSDITITFQAISPAQVSTAITQVKAESGDSEKDKQQQAAPQPMFGSRPNTEIDDFQFPGWGLKAAFPTKLGSKH